MCHDHSVKSAVHQRGEMDCIERLDVRQNGLCFSEHRLSEWDHMQVVEKCVAALHRQLIAAQNTGKFGFQQAGSEHGTAFVARLTVKPARSLGDCPYMIRTATEVSRR